MRKKKKLKKIEDVVLLPIKISSEEKKKLRNYAEKTGDRFMTRAVRRLILEAIKR